MLNFAHSHVEHERVKAEIHAAIFYIYSMHTAENKIVNATTIDAQREEREATPAKGDDEKVILCVCGSGNIFH